MLATKCGCTFNLPCSLCSISVFSTCICYPTVDVKDFKILKVFQKAQKKRQSFHLECRFICGAGEGTRTLTRRLAPKGDVTSVKDCKLYLKSFLKPEIWFVVELNLFFYVSVSSASACTVLTIALIDNPQQILW